MDTLRAALGDGVSDHTLSQLLVTHNGSVEAAAAAFFDQSEAANTCGSSSAAQWACLTCTLLHSADETVCVACGAKGPHDSSTDVGAPLSVDTRSLEADLSALVTIDSELFVGPSEHTPKRGSKGFANLTNGDCLPHALGLATQYLLGRKVVRDAEHISIAAQMRALLHRHMDDKWFEVPGVSPTMAWSELVTLAHNTCVSEEERAEFGHWGDDAEQQRLQWRAERDSIYCGIPELLAFSECLCRVGVDISLRIWRQVHGVLQLSTRVPEPAAADMAPAAQLIVLDLQLTGELDSVGAHYKLLQTGSLHLGVPKSQKRKRD